MRTLVLFISALFLCLSVNAQGYKEKQFNKMVDQLLSHTVKEVQAKDVTYDSSVVYLDAREISEYYISKIENAQWVGYDDFDISRVENIDKSQSIIVYCSVGYRSEKVAEKLKATGFTNVSNMIGGIFEWVNYSKPVVDKANRKTKKIHGFDEAWGKWLDDSLVEKVYK